VEVLLNRGGGILWNQSSSSPIHRAIVAVAGLPVIDVIDGSVIDIIDGSVINVIGGSVIDIIDGSVVDILAKL